VTIVEFLRARYDEDERRARAAAPGWDGERDQYEWQDLSDQAFAHARSHDPARVLREVEAKRRIVKRIAAEIRAVGPSLASTWVLHALAMPYADHPDYDPTWSPT
jgi:hypothetical protein